MNLHCCAGRHFRRPPSNANGRQRAIFDNQLKWVSGTELTYSFMGGSESWRAAMRSAFAEWMRWASITFREVPSGGKIRIAFNQNDGAWSYIGRDILTIPDSEPTMNIGWSPASDPTMALHEIGHTLALHHEHQHPVGIEWDADAVIDELTGPPNYWDLATIEFNVLNVVPREQVTGSDIADPDSVMMYPIPANWILSGPYAQTGINPAGGISVGDKYWAAIVYPALEPTDPEEPTEPDNPDDPDPKVVAGPIEVELNLSRGEQSRLRFHVPVACEYELGTTGRADTVCVLFEDGQQIAADDDSGTRYNAQIVQELRPGREYELVTRLYYRNQSGDVSIQVVPR